MTEFIQLLINTNTINFLIVSAIVIFLLVKLNVKQNLIDISEEIKSYVDTSVREKEQTEKDLSIINDKIERLPALVERIKKSSENNVANIAKKIEIETENKKKDIENNANRIFELETKKFKSKLVSLLSEKSIEVVQKNAIEQLNNNMELHNKYIDNAIEEINRINL